MVVRWRHLCLTAPSRCMAILQDMSESSRYPSPFCSITVPKRGTTIVVFGFICGRLQCHVSGARRPRFATSARAWRRSHLQTARFDSHVRPGVVAFDFLAAEAVVHWRNRPGWNKHIYAANIPRYIDPCLFKLCRDASHFPFYGFDE